MWSDYEPTVLKIVSSQEVWQARDIRIVPNFSVSEVAEILDHAPRGVVKNPHQRGPVRHDSAGASGYQECHGTGAIPKSNPITDTAPSQTTSGGRTTGRNQNYHGSNVLIVGGHMKPPQALQHHGNHGPASCLGHRHTTLL